MSKQSHSRWQQYSIEQALKYRRILVISGARQCGKTTLAQQVQDKQSIYRTLDDAASRKVATDDPHGFVKHGTELMIIDEIQRVPDLLPAIKLDVDNQQEPGRFLITGSANIHALPGVNESLAGRMTKIRLRPLTYGELYGKKPQFIISAFQETFATCKPTQGKTYSKDDYIEYALKGGYPEAILLPEKETKRWHLDYIDAIIERDLKDIFNIKRTDDMRKLVNALAAWSAQFMNIESIGAPLGLSRPTLESYINALEALFIIDRVPAWTTSDYDRINKHDKLFMADTGLMGSLLNWNLSNIQLDGKKHGKLIETFIFTQLAAILEAQEDKFKLYHYRDRDKREIDFIVEDEAGALVGIEVKSGSAVSKDDFKHLKWFKERLAKDRPFIGIVLYTGEHVLPYGPHFWAVPMCTLWS